MVPLDHRLNGSVEFVTGSSVRGLNNGAPTTLLPIVDGFVEFQTLLTSMQGRSVRGQCVGPSWKSESMTVSTMPSSCLDCTSEKGPNVIKRCCHRISRVRCLSSEGTQEMLTQQWSQRTPSLT